MENAVVYARYSSHNQTEQSIEGQLYAARRYAESRGYVIVQEYCDRAKTGTNDNREEFQRMLSDCSKKQFTVIIVWKVDRFGRNREEITFNKYRAKKHGVRVEYVAETIAEGPEGVILESVLEGMAEYYSKQLSQNVRRGLLESAKKYRVVGGIAPLGYKMDENKQYAIDPENAEIVKLIFSKYLSGMSLAEITVFLNTNGYRTRRGKPFDKNSLPRILTNIRYTGTYVYKDLIYEEDIIPAIISKEDFEKVQIRMKTNFRKPSKRWNYTDFLLSDKLTCGYCGGKMTGCSGYGEHGKKYNYYKCPNRTHSIKQEVLEGMVIEEVVSVLSDQELVESIIDKTWALYQERNETKKESDRLDRLVKSTDDKIENIIRSIEEGMPYELVKARLEQLRADRAILAREYAELQISSELELTRGHIESFIQRFAAMDYTDRKCQKTMIEVFINSVIVFKDRIAIVLNYSDSTKTKKFEYDDKTRAFTSVDELCWMGENIILVKKLNR